MSTGRQLVLGLVGGLVAGIAILAAIAVVVDDDDSGTDAVAAGPDTTAGDDGATPSESLDNIDRTALGPEALELVELIDQAKVLTYRAKYRANVQSEQGPSTVEIEIFRDPPLARRDTTISGATSLGTREYSNEDGYTACFQTDEGLPYNCVPAGFEQQGLDPGDVIFGAVSDDLEDRDVTVANDVIGERRVKCFVIEGGGADLTTELCLEDSGIPVVIDAGDGRLTLVELEREVQAEDFEPPVGSLGS